MKPSTGTKPHESDCDTMTSTLDPDEQLQFHLENIRRSLDGNDKASTLDLKNFNLSELTATLFSTDSDTMDLRTDSFNSLTLDENTLDCNKHSNTDSILTSEPDTGTVASLSGVQLVMSDSPVDLRDNTFDVINFMDMPGDIMDDLDEYLDGEFDSPYSTLDTRSSLSVPGGSQYSTLDTASSPHQRIVSQPIPTVDSLSQMMFKIPNQMYSDHEDSLERVTTIPNPNQTTRAGIPDPNQTTRSITYVSSFSLDTMEKGEEEGEEPGDVMDDVIRSIAPASYDDCSLKLIQTPQSSYSDGSMTKPITYPTLHGDEVRTLTPDIDPLISDNLDNDNKDKTIESSSLPKEHNIKENSTNVGSGERNAMSAESSQPNGHDDDESGARNRAVSVPSRPRVGSYVGNLIKRSVSQSGNLQRYCANLTYKRTSSQSSDHKRASSQSGDLKRSSSQTGNVKRSSSQTGDIKRSSSQTGNIKRSSSQSSDLKRSNSQSGDLKRSSSQSGDLKRSSSQSGNGKGSSSQSGSIKRSSSQSGSIKKSSSQSGSIKKSSSGGLKRFSFALGDLKRSSSQSGDVKKLSSQSGNIKRSSSQSGDLKSGRSTGASGSGLVRSRAGSVPNRPRAGSDAGDIKRSSSASGKKRPVSMFCERSGFKMQVSNHPSDQDVRDSGFDSLESSSVTSSRPPKPSRGVKRGARTENSTMSSTGGVSGNSLEDVSCPSSPVMSDSSEISPSRHSTSISSLPDLPSSIGRSRSVASNSSDHILTTLDRPRTQSFAGTPIRQAWLQVCCYERDAQTGNFLIDKHKVQIDGKFLHPELNNDPELYRISLTGLVNEERLPKTEKMLPEIGDGVIISRDRATGDVTLTKLCRKDVYLMNDNFLALKEDEKCKGKHEKLEQNTTYTIFNKQKFVEDVRNSAIDLTKIHTIGQVAISFIKINGNSVKGVPCWIKVQCLEAMNLLKSLLAGSTSEEREWLRKPSLDCSQSPRRASKARLSFGKSLSKGSLKDSKSSVNSSDSGNTPIPRTKSKSQMFRNKKKSQVSNGASPEPRSNRNSGVSQHLEPFTLNYDCLDATEEAPPSRALRDNELFRSRRISSPPNHLTSADVSLPLRRDSPSLPNT